MMKARLVLGDASGAKRKEPLSNQAYLFLLLAVLIPLAFTDGLAVLLWHAG
jgi:hypothetical protein